MLGLKVISATKETIIADGSRVIEVTVGITEDDEIVETRKYSYPYGTDLAVIKTELKKIIVEYERERQQRETQSIVDEEEKKVDKTIKKLEDFSI